MNTLLLFLSLSSDPLATGPAWHPFALSTATVDDARKLDGYTVRSTFKVVNPPDYRPNDGLMVVGDDSGDVARTAVLPLDYLVDSGDTLTVEGTLRVIVHPATVVNGVKVPGCTELRVAEARRIR